VGIFKSQRDAIEMLSELAQQEKLCKALLGLESIKPGASCFGHQLKQCKGACIGKEKPELHHARLMMAVARHRLPAWPYAGPIALREADVLHVVDAWCYLGAAQTEDELHELLASGRPVFDADLFKILRKAIKTLVVIKLPPAIAGRDELESIA
jgi:DNA polymerase-3 subunit epsilon